jgi:hypothetical protein
MLRTLPIAAIAERDGREVTRRAHRRPPQGPAPAPSSLARPEIERRRC